MGNIEASFQYIDDLDTSYPTTSDPVSEGDDHIRGIKSVLQTTFPNFEGAVSASDVELSYADGVTSAIQTQLNTLDTKIDTEVAALEGALSAPAGLAIVIRSSTVPTGWTQDTSYNDCMLRVISGATPSQLTSGDSPILMDKVPSHTHAMTGNGSHSHVYNKANYVGGSYFDGNGVGYNPGDVYTSTAPDHAHTIYNNPGGSNWTPNYVDLLLITKAA